MNRFFFLFALVGCGGSVAPLDAAVADTGTPPADTAPPAAPEWAETPSCDAIKASCTAEPATFVVGHAEDLVGLDGARVDFAIRYLREEGVGLSGEHGVVVGRSHVKGTTFEACVCVPYGANNYPQVAAVVYRPGTKGITSADVARASFSQRYATLGDENVGYGLNALPTAAQKEAAVAAMSDRVATITLRNLDKVEGAHVSAGLIADERPVAAQIVGGAVESTSTKLIFTMPGHAWSSERVAFFVDANKNGKCELDGTDMGGFAEPTGDFAGKWLSGAALAPVCEALLPAASRE
jgi:hypothetical protein